MVEIMGPNHPFVVWASCFLWLMAVFAITWSLVLFMLLGDVLIISGTDLVNAIVLLLGIVMMPCTVHMLYTIARGQKIDVNAKVICCPLWLCMVWIIFINSVGIAVCLQKIHVCERTALNSLQYSMEHYRSAPRHKRFLDNLQWSLKCCGLHSYKDWFSKDWYDKIRDYEWDPSSKRKRDAKTQEYVADSVPLSCCKSGSCVSNFLTELGTHSIHTRGCQSSIYRAMLFSLNAHLIFFVTIVVTEILLLHYIACKDREPGSGEYLRQRSLHISHLMAVNNKFELTSASSSCNYDDSDDDVCSDKNYEQNSCQTRGLESHQ